MLSGLLHRHAGRIDGLDGTDGVSLNLVQATDGIVGHAEVMLHPNLRSLLIRDRCLSPQRIATHTGLAIVDSVQTHRPS